ncbi:hypothetical protein PTKIN_Ptkin14bG0036500 [Pterospermum kingtungense]
MRVFFWGARPTEKLPQYPLPTHDLVVGGVIPLEFEVGNYEERDEMPYGKDPETEFQRFIRLRKDDDTDAEMGSGKQSKGFSKLKSNAVGD